MRIDAKKIGFWYNKNMDKNRSIITSASNKFFPSLLNLIGSIKDTNTNHPNIYVYDLGLSYLFKKELENIDKVYILKVPHFVKHWRSCYTWKTYILNNPITELNLYIDAGCQVLKPLDELFDKIDKNGYLTVSQGSNVIIKDITPKEYFDIFNIDKSIGDLEVITAGIFGFKNNDFIKNITNQLYKSGVDKYCLGFSPSELWKNKNVNKTEFIRDCKMFRHDTTMISLLLRKHINNIIVEPVELFSDKENTSPNQYIWNMRMNYGKLKHIYKKYNIYSYINNIYIYIFIKLKTIANKKNV